MMLDKEGQPYLLEVNCNPSLDTDTVYPIEGPDVEPIPPLPTDDTPGVCGAIHHISFDRMQATPI